MDFINFKERCYAIEFAIPTKELQMTYLKKGGCATTIY